MRYDYRFVVLFISSVYFTVFGIYLLEVHFNLLKNLLLTFFLGINIFHITITNFNSVNVGNLSKIHYYSKILYYLSNFSYVMIILATNKTPNYETFILFNIYLFLVISFLSSIYQCLSGRTSTRTPSTEQLIPPNQTELDDIINATLDSIVVEEQSEYDCPICMDNPHEIFVQTVCGHIFHKDCLRTWLLQKNECPNCRAVIISQT